MAQCIRFATITNIWSDSEGGDTDVVDIYVEDTYGGWAFSNFDPEATQEQMQSWCVDVGLDLSLDQLYNLGLLSSYSMKEYVFVPSTGMIYRSISE